MSTTANGNSDATQDKAPATPARTSRAKRTPAKAEAGLVKAETSSEVIVLADDTRLVPTDSLPNHRPVALSDIEVVGTLSSGGSGRPIVANTLQIASTDILPGHRPIAVSTLPIADGALLPGNRPIAPNDVVDPPAPVLMGYLD